MFSSFLISADDSLRLLFCRNIRSQRRHIQVDQPQHFVALLLLRLQLVQHFTDFKQRFAGDAFGRKLFQH